MDRHGRGLSRFADDTSPAFVSAMDWQTKSFSRSLRIAKAGLWLGTESGGLSLLKDKKIST